MMKSDSIWNCSKNITTQIEDIVNWKCNIVSSSVLIVLNLFFFIFCYFNVSLVHILCLIILVSMGLGFLSSMLLNKEGSQLNNFEIVSKSYFEDKSELIVSFINKIASNFLCLILWTDKQSSLCFGLYTLSVFYISTKLSLCSMLFLGLNIILLKKQFIYAFNLYMSPYVNKLIEILLVYIQKFPIPGLSKKARH